jgi:Rad52/22 family double-strand break repair protein
MKRTTNNETTTKTTELFDANAKQNNVLDFSSTLRELRKTVDPNLIRQRAGRRDRNGNVHMVEYVEWHTVADILDEHAPNWGHTVKDIRPIGDIITVTVAITIDGVTREGVGTGKTASETGIKKAEHDALKRAAVKFGIARELYKREFDLIEQDENGVPAEPRQTGDPVAKTLGDMITSKQLAMIRGLSREANVDAEAECATVMHCGIDELSKRGASDLIEHLQNLQRAVPMRRAG